MSTNEPKADTKTKNKKLWKIIVITLIFIILLLFSTIFSLLNLSKQTIAKGVSIKGIDVSNLTIEEATSKMNEAINIELMQPIQLSYGEDYTTDFDIHQIDYSYDVTNSITEAYNIGKNNNIIINNYTLLATAFLGKNIEITDRKSVV